MEYGCIRFNYGPVVRLCNQLRSTESVLRISWIASWNEDRRIVDGDADRLFLGWLEKGLPKWCGRYSLVQFNILSNDVSMKL